MTRSPNGASPIGGPIQTLDAPKPLPPLFGISGFVWIYGALLALTCLAAEAMQGNL